MVIGLHRTEENQEPSGCDQGKLDGYQDVLVFICFNSLLRLHRGKKKKNQRTTGLRLGLIGDVANSKHPLLIIPKVQLHLRLTRRSAIALARYPQKLAKFVCG